MKLNGYGNKQPLWEANGLGGGVGDPPVAPVTPPVAAAPDLSFIPETFHKDGSPDLTAFNAHYQELVAEQAKRTPPPETYDYALPPDLKFDGLDLPEGFQVPLDTETYKPIFDDLTGILKEYGIPAEGAPKLLGLVARMRATDAAQDFAAMREDAKALGTPEQGKARVETVQRRLQTMLPADQAEALLSLTRTSKALMALEKLVGPTSLAAPITAPKSNANLEGLSAFDRLKAINAAQAK